MLESLADVNIKDLMIESPKPKVFVPTFEMGADFTDSDWAKLVANFTEHQDILTPKRNLKQALALRILDPVRVSSVSFKELFIETDDFFKHIKEYDVLSVVAYTLLFPNRESGFTPSWGSAKQSFEAFKRYNLWERFYYENALFLKMFYPDKLSDLNLESEDSLVMRDEINTYYKENTDTSGIINEVSCLLGVKILFPNNQVVIKDIWEECIEFLDEYREIENWDKFGELAMMMKMLASDIKITETGVDLTPYNLKFEPQNEVVLPLRRAF